MSPAEQHSERYAKQLEIEKMLKKAHAGEHAKIAGSTDSPPYFYVRTSFGRCWFWVQIFSGESMTTEQLAARCAKFNDTVTLVNVINLNDLMAK